MKRGSVGLADRIALIALGGIVLSLVIWLAYAFVGGVLFNGVDLTTSLVTPGPEEAWNRLVAIVAVLIATLILQTLTARKIQAEQALAVEQSRTRQMYENSPDGVVCMQSDRTVTYANIKAEALAGAGPGELVGKRCHEAIFGLEAPCDSCGLDEILRTGQVLSRRDQVCSSDGQERWLSRIAYPIRDTEGAIESVVEMVRDVTDLHEAEEALRRSHLELEMRIEQRTAQLQDANDRLQGEVTERQRAENALRESEQRYRRLIEHSPDMILVHHQDEVTFVNAAGLRLLGAESLDEALGARVTSLWEPDGSGLTPAELSAAVRKGAARRPLSVKLRRLDGSLVDVEVTATPLVVDGQDYVQCVAHDITERLRAEETIKQMAFYDGLTGLPNRTLFRDRLVASIARAARSDSTIAVAFLDLDDFKAINDTLGHALGDELLAAVGARLQGLLRENDTVARHSGDEFTVIAELKSDTDAARLAERISEGLRPVFHVAGHDLHVTASIGIALCPEHGTDEVELLKMADTAMYRAKEIGHSQFRLYDPGMSRAAHDRLELESELRRGIENGEFELFYQPQIDLRSGKARGVEALLRWRHPERGLLSPDSFLEVAEQAGLVNHLGRWVMAEACSQAKAWEAQGVYVGVVAVNLSARESCSVMWFRWCLRRLRTRASRPTVSRSRSPRTSLCTTLTTSCALSVACVSWVSASRSMISAPVTHR